MKLNEYIFLIGFMGCGKSTNARYLSKMTGAEQMEMDQKIVEISGRAYFNGDIVPDISNITGGEGYIFDEKREIHQGFKRRNPDGTVNHTEIQFK